MNYRETNMEKPIPIKYLITSDFTPRQYTVKDSIPTNNPFFPKSGENNHLHVIQLDKRNRHYKKKDNFDHHTNISLGDIYHYEYKKNMHQFTGKNKKKEGL